MAAGSTVKVALSHDSLTLVLAVGRKSQLLSTRAAQQGCWNPHGMVVLSSSQSSGREREIERDREGAEGRGREGLKGTSFL